MGGSWLLRIGAALAACLATFAVTVVEAIPSGAAVPALYAYAGGSANPTDCPLQTIPARGCSLDRALAQATKLAATSRTIDLVTPGVNLSTIGDPSHYVGNWSVLLSRTTSLEPLVIQPLPGLTTAPILDGNGGTTDATCLTPVVNPDCTGSILNITSAGYMTVQGFIMANANNTLTDGGGGINNGDGVAGGTITVSAMTFTNLVAYDGGAINNADGTTTPGSGSITVTDSRFISNSADDGGAIDNADASLAPASGSVTVTGSTFTSNKANYGGGAIDNGDNGGSGSLSVSNSTFTSNSAGFDGGAIDNADNGFIDVTGGTGGTSTLAVSGATFHSNSSGSDGGAIDNADMLGIGTLAISGSIFSANTAVDNGGAIDTADNGGTANGTTVVNSVFDHDSAGSDGGAIDNADYSGIGTLAVTGSTFSYESASSNGGAIDNADNGGPGASGGLTVANSSFTSNSATYDGGAIDNADYGGIGTLGVSGSTFTSNTAGADGGAIDNGDSGGVGSGTTVTNSTFTSNVADVDGGAIDNADYGGTGTSVVISGSTFAQNASTTNDGGAIDNGDNDGAGGLAVSTSTFYANTAAYSGGAIDNADSAQSNTGAVTLSVVATTFVGNSALVSGSTIANMAANTFGVGSVTVAANQFADGCDQASGTWTDAGYNVGDATCLNGGVGSTADATLSALIGPLANHGGPTATMLPLSGNPGIYLIPNPTSVAVSALSVALCPTTDQRGTTSTAQRPCNAGSIQALPDKILITSAPLSMAATSSATHAISMAFQDPSGGLNSVGSDTTIHLATSSATGTFATTSGGASVTSVVVPAGSTGVTIFYGDRTAGTPTVTTSATGLISATQIETVTPGPAVSFTVTGPATVLVSAAASITITAKDAYANVATSYQGTIHVTSSDPLAVLPGNYTFVAGDNGVHGTSVTFKTGGSRTVTATDTVTPSVTGTSSAITVTTPAPPPPPPPPPSHGYWLVGADGGIFTYGAAQFHGSTGDITLQRPVVGITPTGDRNGYWLVATDGGIFAFGNSSFHGSIPGIGLAPAGSAGGGPKLAAPIVAMVPSISGQGYFMVASDGGVFAFGDARFAGSCPGIGGCSGAAVAVMPDASGGGYWLVTASGSVYTFGDAASYGSPGPQGSVVTSAVRAPDGRGYWILFANGTVTAFGSAVGRGGPVGAVGGGNPATAIFSTADGGGYWVAAAGGSVFTYGNAPFDGDMSTAHLNSPIIAATGW